SIGLAHQRVKRQEAAVRHSPCTSCARDLTRAKSIVPSRPPVQAAPRTPTYAGARGSSFSIALSLSEPARATPILQAEALQIKDSSSDNEAKSSSGRLCFCSVSIRISGEPAALDRLVAKAANVDKDRQSAIAASA